MARSRNIKPGFFTNDVLGELPPLARLLFAGLWTHCDREGRCEDRPKKIKAALLPYDDCDVDKLLDTLGAAGFIARYGVQGIKVIQVVTWKKHQNPHVKEAPSTLPARCKPDARTVQEPGGGQPAPEQARLIPSSLIPDSLSPDSPETIAQTGAALSMVAEASEKALRARARLIASPDGSLFDTFWKAYPRKDGKKDAKKAFDKLNPSDDTLAVMLGALKRQAVGDDWKNDGGKFIPYPATWLNGERWTDEGVKLASAANTDYEQNQAMLAREAQRGRSLKADPEQIAAARAVAQAARVRTLGASTAPVSVVSLLPGLGKAA